MHSFFKGLSWKQLLLIAFVTIMVYPLWAQPSILNLEQLSELAPEKIEGYRMADPKGRILKIGTLSYSMIERIFVHGKKQIRVMLFDYNNASVMYRQATQKWKNAEDVETDFVLDSAYELEKQSGWLHYDKVNNKSQITLGIQSRFYLVLSGDGVPLDVLDGIAKNFDFAHFPPPEVAISDAKYR
ncbi:MAG: hypothetical protein ACKVOQ_06365 [Cyclobacteriaceae bacterium]